MEVALPLSTPLFWEAIQSVVNHYKGANPDKDLDLIYSIVCYLVWFNQFNTSAILKHKLAAPFGESAIVKNNIYMLMNYTSRAVDTGIYKDILSIRPLQHYVLQGVQLFGVARVHGLVHIFKADVFTELVRMLVHKFVDGQFGNDCVQACFQAGKTPSFLYETVFTLAMRAIWTCDTDVIKHLINGWTGADAFIRRVVIEMPRAVSKAELFCTDTFLGYCTSEDGSVPLIVSNENETRYIAPFSSELCQWLIDIAAGQLPHAYMLTQHIHTIARDSMLASCLHEILASGDMKMNTAIKHVFVKYRPQFAALVESCKKLDVTGMFGDVLDVIAHHAPPADIVHHALPKAVETLTLDDSDDLHGAHKRQNVGPTMPTVSSPHAVAQQPLFRTGKKPQNKRPR